MGTASTASRDTGVLGEDTRWRNWCEPRPGWGGEGPAPGAQGDEETQACQARTHAQAELAYGI